MGNPKVARPQWGRGALRNHHTMYLDEAEYGALSGLPGHCLSKQRLSFPPMGVDVFAEPEFHDDETMAAFVSPPWCGHEVTGHPGLTGASLARTAGMAGSDAAAALTAVLASFGRTQ